MLKRLTVAVAALFALAGQAFAAGTIPYSLSQQLDEFGVPLAGCKLYLIQAGTVSTPQNGYSDSGLTLVLPNPLTCDASGRLPQFFLADGSIKVRLTKSSGVNVVTADGILVVGASSGGGGGSPVDPTTVIATGDIKVRYGVGVLTGFVRMNGRTIGSATSGATERANADTQALFEYIWNNDPSLVVVGGIGASSSADWAANKAVTIPDMRGRSLAGLDDMGNTALGSITTATCSVPTRLGFKCGSETKTIAQINLPALTWPSTLSVTNGTLAAVNSTLGISNTLSLFDPGHSHSLTNGTGVVHTGGGTQLPGGAAGAVSDITVGGNTTGILLNGSVSLTGSVSLSGGVAFSGSVTSGGSGTPVSSLLPVMMMTYYMKL